MSINNKNDLNAQIFGKIPPQALEAERAVLGALMLEKNALNDVLPVIEHPEIFYTDAHQKIYATILKLHRIGSVIDLITVTNELNNSGELEIIGGPYYLTNLTMDVVSGAHIEAHSRIIREKHIARELIRIAGVVIKKAYDNSEDVFDLADFAASEVSKAKSVKNVYDWRTVGEIAQQLIAHMDVVKNAPPGITTGFSKLDKEKMFFMDGDLIIIGARPSVGKSALMLMMAIAGAKQGKKIGVISLEMMNKSLFARMAGMESKISYKQIYFNYLQEERMKDLFTAIERLNGLPIFFSDTAKVNISDIAAKAHRLKEKYGLDELFIDYLQLVEGEGRSIRYEEITKISRGLKTLAMELGIPIIALAQLNRESETQNRKPKMSDLRDSGGIEQDADGIMLLHRDWRTGKTADEFGNSTEHEADLMIPKWRNGEPVDLKLHFDGATMTFSEQAPEINFPHHNDNPYAGIRGNDKPF